MDPQSMYDQGLNSPQPQPGANSAMPLPVAQSGFQVPQPAVYQQPAPNAGYAPAGPTASQAQPIPQPVPSAMSNTGFPASPVYSTAQPVNNPTNFGTAGGGVTTPGQSQPPVAPAQALQQGVPEEAADGDVIEKEWVIKAKQVVDETRHDPFKQVRELNKLKAEYMKKRYDKDLKLPDA